MELTITMADFHIIIINSFNEQYFCIENVLSDEFLGKKI